MVVFAEQDINMELFVTAKSRKEAMEFSSRSVSLAGMGWSLESSSTSSGLSVNRSVGVETPWQFSLLNNWIALSGCLFCWVSWTTSFAGTDVCLGVWSCLRHSLRPLISCGGVSISSRILFTFRLVSALVLWMLFSFWQHWTSFTKGVHHTSILDLESFTFLAFSHADRSSCSSLKTSTDSVWDPQLDLFSSLLSTNCSKMSTWSLVRSAVYHGMKFLIKQTIQDFLWRILLFTNLYLVNTSILKSWKKNPSLPPGSRNSKACFQTIIFFKVRLVKPQKLLLLFSGSFSI